MICNKCGSEYIEGNKFCPSCGESLESNKYEDKNYNKFSNLKPYYQVEFAQMKNSSEYKGKFNVFAFFLSWIWMFAKKMYVGAVVYICLVGWLITYVHSGFGLIFAIALGFRGNYMYYNFYNTKTYKLW